MRVDVAPLPLVHAMSNPVPDVRVKVKSVGAPGFDPPAGMFMVPDRLVDAHPVVPGILPVSVIVREIAAALFIVIVRVLITFATFAVTGPLTA